MSYFLSYPELYSLVGSKVPDYRGLFLRGTGGNASAIGVQQGDAIRNMSGYLGVGYYVKPEFRNGWNTPSFTATGVFTNSQTNIEGFAWAGANGWQVASRDVFIDASRTVPVSSENRPINKAVRYLIRAKS